MNPEHAIPPWAIAAVHAAADCDDPEAVPRAAQRIRDVAKALTDAANDLAAAASIRERAAEETSPRPGGSRRLMDSGR